MTTVHKSALVPYLAEQMYDLVNDIDSYPEFLPWCSNANVLERSESELLASITVSGVGFSKSFTTRNTLELNRSVVMQHVDGPFKSLTGTWTFTPLSDQGCRIELEMDFEVTAGMMAKIFGKFFDKASNKLVDAFTERAKTLYGDGA